MRLGCLCVVVNCCNLKSYFSLCVYVSVLSQITGGVQAMQDTIIQKDHRLSNAMIRYGSFHITLLVMHLSNEGAIDK